MSFQGHFRSFLVLLANVTVKTDMTIYLFAVAVIKTLFLVTMSSVTCYSIQNMATPYRPVNQLFYNIPRWSIAKSSALVSTKINYFLKNNKCGSFLKKIFYNNLYRLNYSC